MKMSEATKLRILYFLAFSCTASWLPIFADYLKEHGLTGIEIGVVLSITPLLMFIVQPFYGMLADRWGYKRCLILSSLLASVSYVFYLFDASFVGLFINTIWMSLAYNGVQPMLDSLSLKLIQQNPSFAYGTLRVAGAAGWAITGTAVGYYIDSIDTSVIFIFSAASMLLTFLFSFLIVEDRTSTQSATGVKPGIGTVLANRDLLIMLFCVFLISIGGTTIWNFYSMYMKENGASASLVGYGISFQGLCELPLFYFSARIIGRFGVKTTLLITVFALALRMLLYSVVSNPQAAISIELLHGVSWSLFWVVCVEYVNGLVREDWRATGQSLLYASYYGIGAIAGNFWTGFLYDASIRISTIFLLNGCVITMVGFLMIVLVKKNGASASLASSGRGTNQ